MKRGTQDFKVIEDFDRLGFKGKKSSQRKSDRIIDRLNHSLDIHKFIKNKKKHIFLNKKFAWIRTCL